MRRFFLALSLSLVLLPVFAAESSPGVLISEVLTDPTGTDTAHEFVELANTTQEPVDISAWEIDPDQLPYFVLPSPTILPGHGVLTIYLRQQGTNTATAIYTGTQFGSTNMGNTKGSVTLYRPGGHDGAHLQDFMQWGEGNQTHSAEAAETGMFSAADFVPALAEGPSFTRICLSGSASCFQGATPTPGVASFTFPDIAPVAPVSDTGTIMGTGTTLPLPPPILLSPTLRLLNVAMNSPTGTADDIEVLVVNDAHGGTGTVLTGEELQVDAQHFSLNGQMVRTGDVLHIGLGTGAMRTATEGNILLRWTQLAGLVATTEQVFLRDDQGRLTDAVCWFREPIPQQELADIQMLQGLWQGDCLSSLLVPTGAILHRKDPALLPQASSWDIVPLPTPSSSSTGVTASPSVSTATTCPVPSGIHISEILPNPEGTDTGHEWVELHNTTQQEVSLCGLLLDDEEGGSAPFALKDLRIPPEGFLVIPDTTSKIVLGNTTDSVRLLDSAGATLEEVSYEDAPSGKSYSRV